MKVVTTSHDLPLGCAFVPTMGALHAGHASLFSIAREYCDTVIASIFVNPLQFENKDDLEKYPRTPDLDIELAQRSGVTHLWLPTYDEIYPPDFKRISAGSIANSYEGASRSGHFDGVVTVVGRLFDLVQPRWAVFGEKDFQQLALVKQIADNVQVIAAPIVREEDGLAMSSRNVRLSPQGRAAAPVISRALLTSHSENELRAILATEPLFSLDYADYIDSSTFARSIEGDRAIVAGWIDGVRLIDNAPVKKSAL